MRKQPPTTACGRGLPGKEVLLKTVRRISALIALVVITVVLLVFPFFGVLFMFRSVNTPPVGCYIIAAVVEVFWAAWLVREMWRNHVNARARHEAEVAAVQETRFMPVVTADDDGPQP
jgi:uncharacterized membrane protein